MKARFMQQPPEVTVKLTGGIQFVQLALNPKEVIDIHEGVEVRSWEVDWNEIRFPQGAMSVDKITANPAKYIDYVWTDKTPTAAERLEALEDAVAELAAGGE